MAAIKFNLPVEYSRLSMDERRLVRAQYVREQEGLCHYCKANLEGKPPEEILAKKVKPYLYPNHFFNYPVHLHHNHQSDLTIGAVHAHCNAVLWEHHGE